MTFQRFATHRKKELAQKTAKMLRKEGYKVKIVKDMRPQQCGFMTIRNMTVYDVMVDREAKK